MRCLQMQGDEDVYKRQVIASAMLGVSTSKIVILLLINILLLIVGCLMETTAAIIILTPIFLPIVTQLGVDPVSYTHLSVCISL